MKKLSVSFNIIFCTQDKSNVATGKPGASQVSSITCIHYNNIAKNYHTYNNIEKNKIKNNFQSIAGLTCLAYVFQCTLTGFHKFLARNILNPLITFFNRLHFSPYIPAFEESYIIHMIVIFPFMEVTR